MLCGTSRCLFSDNYKTHKYIVGRAYSCWMLNWWCITWPVGFKKLILLGLTLLAPLFGQIFPTPPPFRPHSPTFVPAKRGAILLWEYCVFCDTHPHPIAIYRLVDRISRNFVWHIHYEICPSAILFNFLRSVITRRKFEDTEWERR